MIIDEVLHYVLANAEFPRVKVKHNVKYANTDIGEIVAIESNYKGEFKVAVTLEGVHWRKWFTDSGSTDKRSYYMRNLELIKGQR